MTLVGISFLMIWSAGVTLAIAVEIRSRRNASPRPIPRGKKRQGSKPKEQADSE